MTKPTSRAQEFLAHDFFTPQTVKGAEVYLMKYIIHDWSDEYAVKILRRLREAADPQKTRLVTIDRAVQYACRGEEGGVEIPGR